MNMITMTERPIECALPQVEPEHNDETWLQARRRHHVALSGLLVMDHIARARPLGRCGEQSGPMKIGPIE